MERRVVLSIRRRMRHRSEYGRCGDDWDVSEGAIIGVRKGGLV
jgi:hypothetical protein